MKTYKELIESFNPNKISFGTNDDTNDSAIETVDMIGMDFTFFKLKDLFYVVYTELGEVKFAASKVFSDYPEDYTMKRISSSNILNIFNSVIFIVEKIIRKNNMSYIFFSGADPKLDKVYRKMTKNKSFIKLMDKLGFIHYQEINKNFIFSKIDINTIPNSFN